MDFRHSRRLPRLVAAVAILAVMLAGSVWPESAAADGDPASDVLATQDVFLPADADASAAQQRVLAGTLVAAAHAGYPVRLAVIASASDLGSITALWRQPQNYAEFLGQELSLTARGPVVVVMPNGFGLYQPGATPAADVAQLARTPAPPRSSGLTSVATAAVQNLARAAGHPIGVVSVSPALAGPSTGSVDVIAWLVFAAGALVMLVAWTLSLRARPLQLGGQRP